ncbi:MAG: hypothetical protein CMH52_07530 [Myxococcales bacterium]|nr:hypothetical protein [Myxococcales bacterium]|tara:strand:- start:277 stop:921 length:645 start_codon:yes stop_codon:yes gene_type:complete
MDNDLDALRSLLGRLKGLDDVAVARVLSQTEEADPELYDLFRSLVEGAQKNESRGSEALTRDGLQSAISQASQTPRVQHLAITFEQMGTSGRSLLESLTRVAPGLAEALKQAMFRFEDLVYADSKGLQLLVGKLNRKTLLYALRATSDDLKSALFDSMSARAAKDIKEELGYMDRVRRSDVRAAQTRVTDLARKMIQDGHLVVIKPEERDEWVD